MMRTACLLGLASHVLAGVVPTPGGLLIEESCIHETDGSVIDVDSYGPCRPSLRGGTVNRVQTYAMSVNRGGDNSIMVQMNTSWNVPELPVKNSGQVVYFWPGFKSKKPEMGLPVLQPVLQYGQHGGSWELQSWFVDGNAFRSFTGPAIKDVVPGDKISSWMEFDADAKVWTCFCSIARTGETSVLQLTSAKLLNVQFHYAMLVLETIMPDESCSLYPKQTSNVTFSDVKVNNKVISWDNEVYTQHQCSQNITENGAGSITLTWTN
eukprot:TRINITY_DN65153_c0_g1_i1.p2 TRINITY_DN65153_c0_g1~~TRINITY_DN65153_c0_g1_i1.p2  ORF type:complete len:266 (+),score=108.77 TRINITY_DN65153_c0_g1_i1:58-855(+)